jgi:hypothetical protein
MESQPISENLCADESITGKKVESDVEYIN